VDYTLGIGIRSSFHEDWINYVKELVDIEFSVTPLTIELSEKGITNQISNLNEIGML
jgi:hypothetical protein